MFAGGKSTKGVGHGMGLSLVHDAVTRLGGTIHYAFDDLSTFIMTIPLRHSEEDKIPAAEKSRPRKRHAKRSAAVKS
jgi:signal transduction histidine kinase